MACHASKVPLPLALCVLALACPPALGHATGVYWTNAHPESVHWIAVGEHLDQPGAPSEPPFALFSESHLFPLGIAVDAAAGKLYWADVGSDAIRVANLDGSGSPATLFTEQAGTSPLGVAIDPNAGTIYWTNRGSREIRAANLDGSGTPVSLFREEDGRLLWGVAIDPVGGKIYWSEGHAVGTSGVGTIRVANLDGSGTPSTLLTEPEGIPLGVAVDAEAQRIFWANLGTHTIRVANLDGSGASTLFSEEVGPVAVAIDAAAGRIYWTNAGADTIEVGNLDQSGAPSTVFGGGFVRGPGSSRWCVRRWAPPYLRSRHAGSMRPSPALGASGHQISPVHSFPGHRARSPISGFATASKCPAPPRRGSPPRAPGPTPAG